jgi:hypothetical protein
MPRGVAGREAKRGEVQSVACNTVPDKGRMGGSGEQSCTRQHFAGAEGSQRSAAYTMIIAQGAGDAAGRGDFHDAESDRK